MKYFETKPAHDLKQHVECFWQFYAGALQDDAPAHVIVPDGAVSLTYVAFPDGQVFAGLTGPSTKAHRTPLTPGAHYAGVRLRPGAAGSVLGANVTEYRDCFGRLAREHPEIINLMQAQAQAGMKRTDLTELLHGAAEIIVETAEPLDMLVCDFADRIMRAGGAASISALSSAAGLGARQLRRRFKYQCGLTPKEFARLRRIRQACIDLLSRAGQPQASTALHSGFSDQAHMTREFREVFGNSTTLVEEYLKQISHGDIVQSISEKV